MHDRRILRAKAAADPARWGPVLARVEAGVEPPLPGLVAQAANAAGAVAAHIAAGCPTVDDATHAARLAICQGCDQYRASDGRCAQCGCWIVEAKARWAEQRCPLAKW